MSSYIGHYAELYDQIYTDKPYKSEVKFICHQIRKSARTKGNKLLELASGTGTHALLLEKEGFDVTASDHSDSMLAVAQRKISDAKSRIRLEKIDMTKIPRFAKTFDAVLCLFDSIGYVLTDSSIHEVLQGVRHSLVDGGLFLFEFWHAPAMIRNFEPFRERHYDLPNGHTVRRVSKTTLDYETCLATVAYTLDEYDGKKKLFHLEEVQKNRFFTVPEMKMFLTVNRFEPLHFFSGYSEKEKITDQTFHIVCLARKNNV